MRIVFILLVICAVAMIVEGLRPDVGTTQRELKLAYVMLPGGPAHEAAQYFAQLVEEKTNGKITIKLFASAQLGNDRELAEGLMIGSVDFVLGGTAPIGWYLPEYGAVESPFAFRDYGHMDRVFSGEIGDEISLALQQKKGIKVLDWWHRGPRYLTTTSHRVSRPEDLHGLKLRVPELPTYIEAWSILGANPTPITYSEIFMALKQGIVEGQENPLEVIYSSSLHEVQRYVMETEHQLGCYMLMVGNQVFESLSEDVQEAIRAAAVESGHREHELMVDYESQFRKKLIEQGVEFVEVDQQAFRDPVVEELPRRFETVWAKDFFQRIINTP